jgi:hypothetical protein
MINIHITFFGLKLITLCYGPGAFLTLDPWQGWKNLWIPGCLSWIRNNGKLNPCWNGRDSQQCSVLEIILVVALGNFFRAFPVPEFIDPRFRENKPKTLVFSHRKRAFWACFRENSVYNFRHWTPRIRPCFKNWYSVSGQFEYRIYWDELIQTFGTNSVGTFCSPHPNTGTLQTQFTTSWKLVGSSRFLVPLQI